MKRKAYTITVPKPCHENWETMTQEEKGRFCKACGRHLTDFSILSDQELVRRIQNSNGNICGRFVPSQLNRTLVEARQSGWGLSLGRVFAALVLVGAGTDVIAQPNPPESQMVLNGKGKKQRNTHTAGNLVKGVVLNSVTKAPVEFARIHLMGSKVYVTSDANGNFEIRIPDSLMKDTIRLEIRMVGYARFEVELNRFELSDKHQFLLVEMKETIHLIMGKMMIIDQDSLPEKKKKGR